MTSSAHVCACCSVMLQRNASRLIKRVPRLTKSPATIPLSLDLAKSHKHSLKLCPTDTVKALFKLILLFPCNV